MKYSINLQDRAYNEIKELLGNCEEITDVQEFNKLTFTKQCIKEALRLFPPIPFLMRKNDKDITLKGLSKN